MNLKLLGAAGAMTAVFLLVGPTDASVTFSAKTYSARLAGVRAGMYLESIVDKLKNGGFRNITKGGFMKTKPNQVGTGIRFVESYGKAEKSGAWVEGLTLVQKAYSDKQAYPDPGSPVGILILTRSYKARHPGPKVVDDLLTRNLGPAPTCNLKEGALFLYDVDWHLAQVDANDCSNAIAADLKVFTHGALVTVKTVKGTQLVDQFDVTQFGPEMLALMLPKSAAPATAAPAAPQDNLATEGL